MPLGKVMGTNFGSNKFDWKTKKEKIKTKPIEINIIKKLNNIITTKNLIGFIGVVPILFKSEEFLNSNMLCGIKTKPIVKMLTAIPPGK